MLKKTPKIISLIKKLSPNTKLIGFKLLENVKKNYLINVARKLMIKNDCDYVIANDLTQINENEHIAYLINNKNEEIIEMKTKLEIANNINRLIS